MIASNVKPNGFLGHIGRAEYFMVPDPFLFVLATAQWIFATTIGQIARCNDHLRSDDVDHFGTERAQILFS